MTAFDLGLIFASGALCGLLAGAWATTAWVARHDRRSAARILGLMPRTGYSDQPDVVPNPNGRP